MTLTLFKGSWQGEEWDHELSAHSNCDANEAKAIAASPHGQMDFMLLEKVSKMNGIYSCLPITFHPILSGEQAQH